MNTENNKIIAEFMGLSQLEKRNPNTILYHKDWNWLMEVVEKILTVGDNTDQWDNILNELQTVNINNVYNACVEFIKWYNEKHNL